MRVEVGVCGLLLISGEVFVLLSSLGVLAQERSSSVQGSGALSAMITWPRLPFPSIMFGAHPRIEPNKLRDEWA